MAGKNKQNNSPKQPALNKAETTPKKPAKRKGHVHAIVYSVLSILIAQIAFILPVLSPSLLDKSKQLVSRVPIPPFLQDFLPDSPVNLYKEHYRAFYKTPESISALETAKKAFLSSPDGKAYGYGKQPNEKLFNVEKIVAKETKRFANNLYFDYTGSGVYQERQVRLAQEDLLNGMFGNAHSENPSSSHTGVTVEAFRDRVLKHFNVTAGEYSVIFTSGATGALKLIAESFPWTDRSRFVYLLQDHNSVLGIREVALDQGAQFMAIPESEMADDSCNELFGGTPCGPEGEKNESFVQRGKTRKNVLLTDFPEHTYNLFAFPAEENFAGVKYPLEWINLFHERSRGEKGTGNWLVLLDAAAYVPTNTLDLHKYPADFVSVSFYKIFGYPTGLGVLLVRNSIVDVMQKTFFGGGTVSMSSSDRHFCMLAQNPCSKFEDGTINFLSIAEAEYGFRALEELTHSPAAADMSAVTEHVWGLTHWLYNELKEMKHKNGRPVFKIYGKHSDKDAHDKQGGIINLSVLNNDGTFVGYHTVQELTSKKNVHIRTGCNCNPGACYDYLGISSEEVIDISLSKTSCHDDVDMTDEGKPLGAVRVSLGYLTTFEDVHAFINIMRELFSH